MGRGHTDSSTGIAGTTKQSDETQACNDHCPGLLRHRHGARGRLRRRRAALLGSADRSQRPQHRALGRRRSPGLLQRSRRRRRRRDRRRRPRLRLAGRPQRGTRPDRGRRRRSAGAGRSDRRRRPARRLDRRRRIRSSQRNDRRSRRRRRTLGRRQRSPRHGGRPASRRRLDRRGAVRHRRHPNGNQPDGDDRPLRPGADRRPQLRHRLVRDTALPAADLPVLRDRVRDPLGGARLDQQDRDRLRHQHGALDRRGDRVDAVPALQLGGLRARRQRRRAQGPLQPGRRDLRRRPPAQDQRRQRRPLQGDLHLQPRRLVRAGGAGHGARLRQASARPARLAHRPHPGRPLPGRRRRQLRRRPLGPRRAEAHEQRRRRLRRNDLLLPDPARDQHLLPAGGPGRRRQRRRDQGDGDLAEAGRVHRPRRRLPQPLRLRRTW